MKLALVGATGMVGKVLLKILEERNFPIEELFVVASKKSVGKSVSFKGSKIIIVGIEKALENKPNIAIFSAGGKISKQWAPLFAKAGTTVIDNSSAWRMDSNIKLVVPEINAKLLSKNDKIIANPNCSTIQMLVALKPLHNAFQIKRIDITTLQAVSGTGKEATEELIGQLSSYNGNKVSVTSVYPKQIANNVLPHCGDFDENRYTEEENKILKETHKILDNKIEVTATCVRVPVLNGHSESLHLETKETISEEQAISVLQDAPGLKLHHGLEADDYPTATTDADGDNLVHVGRLRKDLWSNNRINLWIAADNLLKGAALNSLQIAELIFD